MTGPACSDNIVLGTTFWDCVDEQLGVERQLELQMVPEFGAQPLTEVLK